MLRLRFIIKALLCLCLGASVALAQQTPRLVFTKTTPLTLDKMLRKHVVVKGEHLFKILRSYGILNEDLNRVLDLMAELNPGIHDLNVLSPGQVLVIPLTPDLPAQAREARSSQGQTQAGNATAKATGKISGKSAGKSASQAEAQAEAKGGRAHVVGSGETLVKILRGMGVPDSLIYNEYLNMTKALNPGLGNMGNLSAGQTIYLPLPPQAQAAPAPETPQPAPKPSPTPTPAPARNGKSQPETGKSAPAEPEVRFVQVSNATAAPGGKPTRNGQSGQSGQPGQAGQPSPGPAAVQTGKPAGAPAVQGTPTPVPPPAKSAQGVTPDERDLIQKSISLSFLRTLGFWTSPGQEVLYPSGDGKWLRLQLTRTPMLTAPWGRNVILAPPDAFSSAERQNIESMSISICPVPSAWTPDEVLRAVSDRSGGVMRLWSSDHPLILNAEGVVLELSGDHVIQIKSGNQRGFYILNLIPPGGTQIPNLLQAYLSRKAITAVEWEVSQTGRAVAVGGSWPGMGSLIVSEVSSDNAWATLQPRLTPAGQRTAVNGPDLDSVLAALRKSGLAKDTFIKLSWFEGERRNLKLRVPAVEIQGAHPFYLIRPAQADPYLMALLALEGRDCLAIR